MCFWSRWRYVEMKRKLDYFYIFSFLIKVWMPSTSAISYTINLLELWFPLISKINLFLSFHIPILHLFNYRIVLQNFNLYYFRDAHLFRMLCCVVCFLPVSCVPNVASVSGLSILDWPMWLVLHVPVMFLSTVIKLTATIYM